MEECWQGQIHGVEVDFLLVNKISISSLARVVLAWWVGKQNGCWVVACAFRYRGEHDGDRWSRSMVTVFKLIPLFASTWIARF